MCIHSLQNLSFLVRAILSSNSLIVIIIQIFLMYLLVISSRPVHHRRSSISCPSSPLPTSSTSCPSTSAPRALLVMTTAEPRPCAHAHVASGTKQSIVVKLGVSFLPVGHETIDHFYPFFCGFQPWKISIVLRPRDYYDESCLQRTFS